MGLTQAQQKELSKNLESLGWSTARPVNIVSNKSVKESSSGSTSQLSFGELSSLSGQGVARDPLTIRTKGKRSVKMPVTIGGVGGIDQARWGTSSASIGAASDDGFWQSLGMEQPRPLPSMDFSRHDPYASIGGVSAIDMIQTLEAQSIAEQIDQAQQSRSLTGNGSWFDDVTGAIRGTVDDVKDTTFWVMGGALLVLLMNKK